MDAGYFAQGSYFTFDPDYAWHVYGSIYKSREDDAVARAVADKKFEAGSESEKEFRYQRAPVLLVAKVVTGRVYPAHKRLEAAPVTSTISDVVGRAAKPGYDAHFTIVSKNSANPNVYDAITDEDAPRRGGVFSELVVFDSGQVLPIAIVEPSAVPKLL
jgi:hypothetical protein